MLFGGGSFFFFFFGDRWWRDRYLCCFKIGDYVEGKLVLISDFLVLELTVAFRVYYALRTVFHAAFFVKFEHLLAAAVMHATIA